VTRTRAWGLLQRTDHGDRPPSWRLFHHALAEHLRDQQQRAGLLTRRQADERIVGALLEKAPRRAGTDQPDWLAADSYTRTHLATHTSTTSQLDHLLADPGFLVAAEPGRLLEALPSVNGHDVLPASQRLLYRVGARLQGRPAEERAAILELGARQLDARTLAAQLAALRLSRPWSIRWGHQLPHGADRIVGWHDGPVRAIAVGEREGRLVAVSGGSDGMVCVWDLRTGVSLLAWPHGPAGLSERDGAGEQHRKSSVEAVAVGELADGPVVVSGGADGTLRCWRLADGSPRGGPLANPWSRIRSVVVGELAGRPVVVAGGDGGPVLDGERKRAVCVWDLETWDLETAELLHVLEPDCTSRPSDDLMVSAVAMGSCGDQPVVVAGHDRGARQWTWTGTAWASRTLIPEKVRGHRPHPWAVALGVLNGRPIAVCGGHPKWITTFDLESGTRATPAFDAPDGDVIGVAAGELDGRAIAVSGNFFGFMGDPGVLHVWDLGNEEEPLRGSLVGHYGGVQALAVTRLDDRPAVVSGGMDHTVRAWDLATSLQPARGRHEYYHINWLLACELQGSSAVVCNSNRITPSAAISKSPLWHEQDRDDVPREALADLIIVPTSGIRRRQRRPKPPPSVIRAWDQANGEPISAASLNADRLGRLCAVGRAGDTVLGVEVDEPTWRPELDYLLTDMPGDDTTRLRVWDLQSGTQVGRPTLDRPPGALDYNIAVGGLGDQEVVAFCDEHGRIQVLDVHSGEPVWAEPLPTFGGGSALRAFGAPAGRPIAVVQAPWKAGIWDLQRRGSAEPLAMPHSMQPELWGSFPMAVGVLAGRPVVVYSGYGRPIRVWDLTTHHECERAIWVDTKIAAITVTPDSTILASGPTGTVLALRVEASFFDPPLRAEQL